MKAKSIKTLVVSILAIITCFAMLLGTTFAWFTDSVNSSNNKIQSGNLKVDLELLDKDTGLWNSIKEDKTALFNYENWEPGYTEVKVLKVENEGSLALKWKAKFVSNEQLSILADVIDVYVKPSETEIGYPADRSLAGYKKVGTVAEFVNTIEETTKGELASEEVAYLGIALKMQENAGNEYQLKTIGAFDIQIVATQYTAEKDSFANDYDANSTYPNVSMLVAIPDTATESASFSAGVVETELPADLLNNLPAEVESAKLVVANPEVDEVNKTVSFSAIDFLDQDGKVIDLSANNIAFTVTLNLPSLANEVVEIFHDGASITKKVVSADGTLTYEVEHFCEVEVKATADETYNGSTLVSNADELIEALEAGNSVIFTNDIKINPANMSNAYGTTGINVKNGQTIDGNGNILDIKGAGGTWDSGINTTGGIIKNIKITGSFRGIFINHNSDYSETVVLENVVLDGTVYTISCDQGKQQTLVATNCTFKGWTSYAATLGSAKFVNCYFGEGSGYSYCRPYASTEFVGCDFEAGFRMDTRATTTFEGCRVAGVELTAENLATLVVSNIANATVK